MNINLLKEKSLQIRRTILKAALSAGKGHIPPCYSWTDIASVLFYGNILNISPNKPDWKDRDRFVLSKGHAALTLYSILADLKYFSTDELEKFATGGALLPGHPDAEIPGVEVCTGSLGHGLGVASGMAFASKKDNLSWSTYVVLGDGECQEGSVWEAIMFAGHQELGKLIAIVDRNTFGATDSTENTARLNPLDDKFKAFGWDVEEVDGHNFDSLTSVLSKTKTRTHKNKPLCIIANTTKGKGIDFMENSQYWHHQIPKGEQIDIAWDQRGGKWID